MFLQASTQEAADLECTAAWLKLCDMIALGAYLFGPVAFADKMDPPPHTLESKLNGILRHRAGVRRKRAGSVRRPGEYVLARNDQRWA